jgi:hypothetical protein
MLMRFDVMKHEDCVVPWRQLCNRQGIVAIDNESSPAYTAADLVANSNDWGTR